MIKFSYGNISEVWNWICSVKDPNDIYQYGAWICGESDRIEFRTIKNGEDIGIREVNYGDIVTIDENYLLTVRKYK